MKHYSVLAALCLVALIHPAQAGTCVVKSAETFNCREIEATLISGEQQQKDAGVACLQNSGLWKVVSGPGFGMSFSGRDTTMPYLAGSYMINGVYYQQPAKIHFVVQHNSACVPEMPAALQTPVIVYPGTAVQGQAYPSTLPAQTTHSSNGGTFQ